MTQIFVFGASTAYGVGGRSGGWPDLLKQRLHEEMYALSQLPPEKHEIYNLCVPGATVADVKERLAIELKSYAKPGRQQIVTIELGGNDAKAIETPSNYTNTPEVFVQELKELVDIAKMHAEHILLVGLQPVDETKTAPRTNPWTERKVYFTNQRMNLFEESIADLAQKENITYIPIFAEASKLNWEKEYLFEDGLHPNEKGHQWLYEKVYSAIKKLL
ncbi:hypothetical protein HY218_02765 [Candidatus Saccharibacteria bacterium]|nr:hypothetical protein [Candidatus Saccharibacteria bacterium]